METSHFIIHVSGSVISHLLSHYPNDFLDECILIKKNRMNFNYYK